MKSSFFILIIIMSFIIFAQTEKGISIKSKTGNEGKRWAICVGINNYDYAGVLDLKKARNDADYLGKVLKEYGQFDYVFILTDSDPRSVDYPSAGKFRSKLKYLEQFLEPEDLVVFSFSGHGVSDPEGNGYLLMTDSDPDNIFNTSIKINEITDVLEKAKVKKSLLLVDACREEFRENKGINKYGIKSDKFEQSEIAAAFYATRAGGFSYEDDKTEFGAFTNYLLKGMRGEADEPGYQGNSDGIVTFSELASFVENGVMNWAIEKGKIQKPYTKIYGEKFGDLALTSYKFKNTDSKQNEKESPENSVTPKTRIKMELTSKSGIELVFVGGDKFNFDGASVTLHDFYIGKKEITQSEWLVVMGNNPSFFKGERYPVEEISWFDAVEFCNKLSIKEGLKEFYSGTGENIRENAGSDGYRLPTELEWDYAASGGAVDSLNEFSGGNNIDEVAVYIKNSNRSTAEVATKKANELGIYDMSGNVFEWCWDWYFPNQALSDQPQNIKSGSYRVIKGGSWLDYPDNCRFSKRNGTYPSNGNSSTGFRIAKNVK